jgi:2-keto-4-pentenoate hydratase/2-oxohepta-3-ene-1,7-dioic acid hydratase in catechol pathway
MKLVTFDDGKVGRLEGETIAELDVPTMREYFERGGADVTGREHPLADVKLRAPIVPKKFFHTSGNFREHEDESKRVNWSHEIAPWIVFFQNVDAIIGPDEAIVYPEHLQRNEMRSGVFSFCKAIDTFCPLGPWIVTPDEIGDPHDLSMELRVNGESRQVSNMNHMSTSVPEVLSHYSPLGYSAGDILSLGTVSGVAGFSEDPFAWYLKAGDVIEAEIEKIGVLRNPVVSWQDAHG